MPASNGPVSGPNALILLNAFMSPHSSGEGTADDIVDGKSADRTSEDDPDSVKWEELPAPPLQIICSYLVDQPARIFGNYRQIEQVCKSLDAFRKTCRHFATAVNSFLKNSANLPLIGFIRVRDTGDQLRTDFYMPTVYYLMHPLSQILGSIKHAYIHMNPYKVREQFMKNVYNIIWFNFPSTAIYRCARDTETIEEISTMLRGSVLQLLVQCSTVVRSLAKFTHLTRNLSTIDQLRIECSILGDEMSFDILVLVKAHSVKILTLDFYRHELTNPSAFINELVSTCVSNAYLLARSRMSHFVLPSSVSRSHSGRISCRRRFGKRNSK